MYPTLKKVKVLFLRRTKRKSWTRTWTRKIWVSRAERPEANRFSSFPCTHSSLKTGRTGQFVNLISTCGTGISLLLAKYEPFLDAGKFFCPVAHLPFGPFFLTFIHHKISII